LEFRVGNRPVRFVAQANLADGDLVTIAGYESTGFSGVLLRNDTTGVVYRGHDLTLPLLVAPLVVCASLPGILGFPSIPYRPFLWCGLILVTMAGFLFWRSVGMARQARALLKIGTPQ
jgi:hypothetical protein